MNTSARMIPVAAVTMTLVLGLSACSVLPKAAPMVTYKLPDYHIAQAESTPRAVPGPGALRVYAPESSRVLDSERLFIAQPDGRLSAWQGVRWADPAPVLLRDRIVAFGVATDILAGQIVEWAVQVGAARLRVAPELASNHAPTASSISTD